MKKLTIKTLFIFALMLCCTASLCAQPKVISSVKELAQAAKGSKGDYKMTPGVYQMADYLTKSVAASTPAADIINRKAMILFSGNNNTFDLTGVTIEVDTKLLGIFNCSTNEFQITGNNNTIKGLTVRDIGTSAPSKGGARSFVVTGDNNKVDGVTLYMSGSSPYGYGDLLGKGNGSVVKLNKHSGMLIEGRADTILNCSIYSKSFGHLFFIQGGRDVYFENCYAEGEIRSTDDMLKEREGVAFKAGFESAYKNMNGTNKIVPGYAKSLNECGFRTYGQGGPDKSKTGAVTVVNCRSKNTRIGFAFTRVNKDIILENCDAQGCEVGYSLSGVSVKSSRGDAELGPLFNINKGGVACDVELELLPASSNYTIHCLGAVAGNNHNIKLTRSAERRRKELPILIGSGRPAANNGYSPFGEAAASGVTISNESGMPIVLSSMSEACSVTVSDGKVTDKGKSNSVAK